MMEGIVVGEDDIRRVEKRFESAVRLMGSSNSDGTFGYASVPLCAVRRAAEDLVDLHLLTWQVPKHRHQRPRTVCIPALAQRPTRMETGMLEDVDGKCRATRPLAASRRQAPA